MHELSIAMAIVDVAIEEAQRHEGRRIHAVHLKVGALSGIEPEALRSAFELAREQTHVASARLIIEEIPLTVHCHSCDAERTPEFPNLSCPVCGSPTPDVIRGRELEVFALEIEFP